MTTLKASLQDPKDLVSRMSSEGGRVYMVADLKFGRAINKDAIFCQLSVRAGVHGTPLNLLEFLCSEVSPF